LKIGGPIVTLRPVAASEISGNVVSSRIAAIRRHVLLNRKLASRRPIPCASDFQVVQARDQRMSAEEVIPEHANALDVRVANEWDR
jgi:hypothetical protein